jgi:hypothetical protein
MAVELVHNALGLIRKLNFTITAAGDGTIADYELPRIEGALLALATSPGGTAPTNNYDVVLRDEWSYDVLESAGLNRSSSAAQRALIRYAATNVHPCVDESDTLTLSVSGNAVPGAQIVCELYYGVKA